MLSFKASADSGLRRGGEPLVDGAALDVELCERGRELPLALAHDRLRRVPGREAHAQGEPDAEGAERQADDELRRSASGQTA